MTDFSQLKEPIPFDQVSSNPWLLEPSANLSDYAARVFRAEKLVDIWAKRDLTRHLHAVVRIGDRCTPVPFHLRRLVNSICTERGP